MRPIIFIQCRDFSAGENNMADVLELRNRFPVRRQILERIEAKEADVVRKTPPIGGAAVPPYSYERTNTVCQSTLIPMRFCACFIHSINRTLVFIRHT